MRLVLLDSDTQPRQRLQAALELVASADEEEVEIVSASIPDGLVLLRVSDAPAAVLVAPDPSDWLGSLRGVLEQSGPAPVLVLADAMSAPFRLEARRAGASDWLVLPGLDALEIWRRARGAHAMAESVPALQLRLLHEVARALQRVEVALTGQEPSEPPRRRGGWSRLVGLLDRRTLQLLLYLVVSLVGIIATAVGVDLIPAATPTEEVPDGNP